MTAFEESLMVCQVSYARPLGYGKYAVDILFVSSRCFQKSIVEQFAYSKDIQTYRQTN